MDIRDLVRRLSKVLLYLPTCNACYMKLTIYFKVSYLQMSVRTVAAYESSKHLYQTTQIAIIHRIVLGHASFGNWHYKMAFGALFRQRALYTVHCINIMHSRKPPFVITLAMLVNSVNCNILYTRQQNAQHFIKQIHRITLHINPVKHPWSSPWAWRNRVMYKRRSVDFKTISVLFTRARRRVVCVAIVTSLLT